MSNSYRYRSGETKPRFGAWKSGTAVYIGDLSYEDSGDSNKIKPAGSFTWGTAIAAPAAPTLTNGAVAVGSALTNALTGVKATYVTEYGETEGSTAGTATPTAGAQIKVTGISLPAGARAIRYYVETSAGSGVYTLFAENRGGSFMIDGYGGAAAPAAPTVSTLGALPVTQAAFAALFAGVAEQQYDGTNANIVGVKDGNVRYSTAGVFEYDTASASYAVGDLVGPAKQSGSLLEPQVVAAVGHRLLAIGRVYEATSSSTKVKVEIFGRPNYLDNQSLGLI